MNTAEKVVEYVKKTLTMDDCKQAFAVPGSDSIVDLVHPVTGRSVHYGNTLEEIRARYPGAELVEFDAWLQSKAERQHSPIEWTETTEEKYFEMLEVLPPAYMGNGGFLVGEPYDHDAGNGQPRWTAFRQVGEKFFAANRPMTIAEFKAAQT